MTTPHEILNPEALAPPTGFSHAVVAARGRTIYLGGATAHDSNGRIVGDTIVEQFDVAAGNVVLALGAAGAHPQHLVTMQIYVTDVPGYRAHLKELAPVYQRHFGTHYPAIALFGVQELFDPKAIVELVCTAVVPD